MSSRTRSAPGRQQQTVAETEAAITQHAEEPPTVVVPPPSVPPLGVPTAVVPAPVVPATVIIEIDAFVAGGPMLNRFDVMLRARTVSIITVRSATLIADGAPRSSVDFGPEPNELTFTLPNGVVAQQRTLHFSLSRPLDRAGEPCPCRIVAEDADGQMHEQAFELTIDPAGTPPVRVTAGPLQPATTTRDRVPVILYVERASIDSDGHLVAEGWALSLNQVVVVQAHVGEQRVVARLGLARVDVAQAYPAYPGAATSGYRIEADLPPALHGVDSIRVEVMCRRGLTHDAVIPIQHEAAAAPEDAPPPASAVSSLSSMGQSTFYSITAGFQFPAEALSQVLNAAPTAPGPAPEPDREIHMFCDETRIEWDGRLVVSGWATSAAGVARIAIMVNGQHAGMAELGHDRPDVGQQHAAIPGARYSGFRFDRTVAERFEGEHTVDIVVTTALSDERVEQAIVVASPAPVAPSATAAASGIAEPDPAKMKFQLDSPHLTHRRASETITGRLTIDGWVLSRSGIDCIEVWMDGQRLGDAHHGLARQDVGAAYADWPNSVRSGFAFHCPPRSLRDGTHEILLIIRCESGYRFERAFEIEVRRAEASGGGLGIQRRLARTGREYLQGLLDRLAHRPPFVVILRQVGPVYPEAATATLRSLDAQAYADWRLVVLCEQAASVEALRPLIDAIGPALTWRSAVLSPDNVGWGEVLVRAADAFHLFLRPGDELGVDALAEFALASGLHRDADLLYADESRISPVTGEREAFLKPDYSPDLLWATNYIGRPWVALGRLLETTGATAASLADHGEYDLVLHCADRAGMIHHVPKLLCHRGTEDPDDDPRSALALQRAAERQGIAVEILPARVPHSWRVRRTAPVKGKVSIIIPTCGAHGHIETCITTLREKTAYPDFEIVVIDNIPANDVAWKIYVAENADHVIDMPDAFNWSRFNNRAAAASNGEFLLFLNDDVEIEQADWLDILVENAARPEVGIVGPRLLYPARTIQHAGMFLAANGIARHAFRFAAEDDPCYFGLALTQRNVIAVTGACMLVRREVFESLGGFDEAHQVVNNDLDFCLRAHRAGLLTVYTPHTTLIHHELASRDRVKAVHDTDHFNSTWAERFGLGDPFFNPRLYRHADDQRPDDEPVEVVHSGQPLFTQDEIRHLLVVKLDHIGDFITALPSIRRLKELFPLARISVLSAPAAQSFAAFEPAIDEFIAFEFFHVKSGMGRKEVTEAELVTLGARLRPYRFDLAIDLRKQPDTRDVLRHCGARYLAGYDHQAQFNFLDVALEWETDRSLHHKRNHVSDDLLNLVEAVGQASRFHRPTLAISTEAAAQALERLPEDARRLFDKPVAIIHPGVGSAVKQWPLPYFATLIDLLVARHGLNIILIGSPDEADLARDLLDQITEKSAVGSLVGQTPLRELPALLANAVLYVGGDSGPKHIAAAVGVPSIGIHSGVVDTMEWGPAGTSAIALRRNMACSPCYLAHAEDCPRALACLKGLEPTLVYEAVVEALGRPLSGEPKHASPVPEQPADVGAPDRASHESSHGPSHGPSSRPAGGKRTRSRGQQTQEEADLTVSAPRARSRPPTKAMA